MMVLGWLALMQPNQVCGSFLDGNDGEALAGNHEAALRLAAFALWKVSSQHQEDGD